MSFGELTFDGTSKVRSATASRASKFASKDFSQKPLYKLPADILKQMADLDAMMDQFIQQQREARDMASERWQESDRASSHEYWLDELDDYRTSHLDAEGGDVPKIEE